MANASQEELAALKAWMDEIRREANKWLDHIKIRPDVGAKLSAALFKKETDVIRQQMVNASQLAPARSILLHSTPTLTRLFSDDARVTKVMEAADKHQPYAPKSSYNSGRGYKPRGAGAVTLTYASSA
jgi:vacuolar-type H+-ATPase subunit E/Vma4